MKIIDGTDTLELVRACVAKGLLHFPTPPAPNSAGVSTVGRVQRAYLTRCRTMKQKRRSRPTKAKAANQTVSTDEKTTIPAITVNPS